MEKADVCLLEALKQLCVGRGKAPLYPHVLVCVSVCFTLPDTFLWVRNVPYGPGQVLRQRRAILLCRVFVVWLFTGDEPLGKLLKSTFSAF